MADKVLQMLHFIGRSQRQCGATNRFSNNYLLKEAYG